MPEYCCNSGTAETTPLVPPVLLAPLAGISDLPFRILNRLFGCQFAFMEMVSARALVLGGGKKMRQMETAPGDKPLGIQFLGSDPDLLRRAMDLVEPSRFAVMDFNAACPVKKVTVRGEGAGLLKEPLKLSSLLRVMVEHSEIPVTAKIRTGWDEGSVNARDTALYCRDAGIQGLFIHGRTRAQGYAGVVDYDEIRRVKESLDIPVIASGDALSPRLIKKLFDETGCDSVAIARGALGNPWIFRETAAFLKSGTVTPRPSIAELKETMLRHLDLCIGFYGEETGVMIFRKFFAWYSRGIPGMKVMKRDAFRAEARADMLLLINRLSEDPVSLEEEEPHEVTLRVL